MHLKTALAFGIAAALLCPAAARAQEVQQVIIRGNDSGPVQVLPPGQQAKTGTGRIRGRIVTADAGTPVRRAQVRISGADIGSKSALTDGNGNYEFKNLPAGRFSLSVVKAGYVTVQYGQRRPFEPGHPIDLADAQLLDKVDVALPRGSVLAGRVVDEFGEPVADANVTAMRMQFVNGRRRLVPAGRNSQTNDLGQYRLFGLAPGEYYVSATLRSMDTMMGDLLGAQGGPTGSNQNSGYAPTYYPGTPNPSDAQRVSVATGQELTSVDIGLQPVRLAKITGTVLMSDGKPMAGAMIMLMPSNHDAMLFMGGNTSRSNANGQFTLNGVAPGDYTLEARSMGAMVSEMAGAAAMVFSVRTNDAPAPQARGDEPEFASVPLSVSGDDMDGMVVTATHGAKASGRLVFAGTAKPESATGIRVLAPPADPGGGPSIGVNDGRVTDAGTFELSGLVGTRLFLVFGAPKGWSLESVTVNGQDVTDTGFDFKPGQDVDDLEITLTDRSTAVTGAVTDDRGEAVKDYTVVVFPSDDQKWTLPNNRWISSGRPDQDGRFSVSNLPPGSYLAVAVDYVANGEWADPDWLQKARDHAVSFTLNKGGTKSLDLKLSSF